MKVVSLVLVMLAAFGLMAAQCSPASTTATQSTSPLELDLPTILFEVINFLVLAVVLYYVLFRRVMNSVKTRAAEKDRLLHDLAQERQAAERLHAELQARLADIDQEIAEIVTQAQEQIEAEHKALLQATEVEVERLLTEAQSEAAQMQQQSLDEFHEQALDTILRVSAHVVDQVAPAELHDVLVKQLNDRIWELGRSEMRQVEAIRRSVSGRTPTIHVDTARALSPEQQGQLVRTFSALADHNVQLDLKTDPALALGLRIRMGDLVVDNSIRAQLDDLRDEVSAALREPTSHE
ncbi:MAG: F0F1 ATP synthase subunit delta [Chloroflexi bacterium]|nr:F0F1 ATP synthase subunit delta [Chloroflexota bacterium]MBU1746056.1 F0F1 ATP synthase subunit delta [Chloroflexota bacterium]